MSSWIQIAGRSATIALAVVGVVAGCSSSDSGSPSVTADEACTQLVAALCDKIQSCAPAYMTLGYGDIAACKTRAMIDCKSDLSAPSTAATPSDTVACANVAKTASCAALFDNDTPAACLPKPGGLEDGKPCAADAQCKSGFCGLDTDKELCGLCAAKPTEGAACNRGKCPAGLQCSRKSTCAKVVAEGGACDDSKPCASGTSCYMAKCVKNAAAGATCDDALVKGPACDGFQGLACLGNKCQKITLVAAGQPCGLEFDGTAVKSFTLCEKNGWCKGLDTAAKPPVLKGTCEAAAKDGDPCVADATFLKGPGCLEPAECVAGKCTLPDAAACK